MRLQRRPLFIGQIMSIEHATVCTASRPQIFAGHALVRADLVDTPVILDRLATLHPDHAKSRVVSSPLAHLTPGS